MYNLLDGQREECVPRNVSICPLKHIVHRLRLNVVNKNSNAYVLVLKNELVPGYLPGLLVPEADARGEGGC